MSKKVIMTQKSPYRWQLESETGIILKDDISVHTAYDAEKWVKNYISSFQCWTYEIRPKERKKE